MKEIYLDNSATTALSQGVKERMTEAMEVFGNPSSLHSAGHRAQLLLEQARLQIWRSLGQRGTPEAGRLLFTSCGSEADNLALFGVAYAKPRRRGGRIISTDAEHPGVENALRCLEKDGFEVVRISTKGGILDRKAFADALNDRVFLVSLMMVNNELGAQYDIADAFRLAKAKNPEVVTHTDAVQGYLKCRFTPQAIGADLVTLSAHKIHGPKGVGALYVSAEAKKRRDLVPTLYGGGQEYGMRSGTENVIGIVGFGAAAEEESRAFAQNAEKLLELRTYAEQKLSALPVQLNLPTGARAPHILHLTLPDIRSETMVHALSTDGIFVSAGSACSSHKAGVSAATLAYGLSREMAECSLRISFSHDNTKDDVDALVQSLERSLDRLVRIHR